MAAGQVLVNGDALPLGDLDGPIKALETSHHPRKRKRKVPGLNKEWTPELNGERRGENHELCDSANVSLKNLLISEKDRNGIDLDINGKIGEQECNCEKPRTEKQEDTMEQPIEVRSNGLKTQEPVAIIGIACTFAGAPNKDAYWQLLSTNGEGLKDVPSDRWDVDNYLSNIPRSKVVRHANFLEEDIYAFDPVPFGISGTEAKHMDPQQRLALHCAWEALEDAGLSAENLRGSEMGVYIGTSNHEYAEVMAVDSTNVHGFAAAGTSLAVMSNRLSYIWDLRGPSVTVDTACSSSLVALHQACQALDQNECSSALVGGVEVMLSPFTFETMTMMGMLAPDGRSKPFTESRDGFGRGEGVGMLVLKRLEDAIGDGDHIYATIRATLVQQDGAASTPMTNLSVEMQERLIRKAYRRAKIETTAVQYIEAHGTGTKVGDLVEMKALGNVLGVGRGENSPLRVGSVKANVGHNEAASGVASVIKVCLMMEHTTIPPVRLHGTCMDKEVDFQGLHLDINTQPLPWTSADNAPLCAGVNCFGFGGTIAHAILDNQTSAQERRSERTCSKKHVNPEITRRFAGSNKRQYVFQFSGHTAERAVDHMRSIADFLQGEEQTQGSGRKGMAERHIPSSKQVAITAGSVAYTLACKRSLLPFRIVVTAADKDSLKKRISDLLALPKKGLQSKVQKIPEQTPPIVFVFSGMGTQWPQMAIDLITCEPVFRETLQQCAEKLRELTNGTIDLLAELHKPSETSRIHETRIAQLSVVSVEISLVALWKNWGVRPTAVVGHSLGEIAAAYASEILSLDDALIIAHCRSSAVSSHCQPGSMLAVNLGAKEAAVEAQRHSDVYVACCNSPQSTVLAGSTEQIAELRSELKAKDVRCTILKTNIAYHTHYVTDASQALTAALEQMKVVHHKPAAAFYSPSSEEPQPIQSNLPHAYWGNNLTQVVKFKATMEYVFTNYPNAVIIEVSAQPHLLQHVAAINHNYQHSYPSLTAQQPGPKCLTTAAARLTEKGVRINWQQVFVHDNVDFVRHLPGIRWRKQHYKCESNISRHYSMGDPAYHEGACFKGEQLEHIILQHSTRSRLANGAYLWQFSLSLDDYPFLGGHRLNGRVILAGMFLLDVCMACIAEISPTAGVKAQLKAEKIKFVRQAYLQEEQLHHFEVVIRPPTDSNQQHQVEVCSKDHVDKPYLVGTISYVNEVGKMAARPVVSSPHSANVTRQEIYKVLNDSGFSHTGAFGTIDSAVLCGHQVIGRLSLASEFREGAKQFILHVGLLDGCLQLVTALRMASISAVLLPSSMEDLKVNTAAVVDSTQCICTMTEIEENHTGITCDIHIVFSENPDSPPALTCRFRYVFLGEAAVTSLFHDLQWKPTASLPASSTLPPLPVHGSSNDQKSQQEANAQWCDHALICINSTAQALSAEFQTALQEDGVSATQTTLGTMEHETDSLDDHDEEEITRYKSVLLSVATSCTTKKQQAKLIKVIVVWHPHQHVSILNLAERCIRSLHHLVKAMAEVHKQDSEVSFSMLLVTIGAPASCSTIGESISQEDICLNMIWGYFRSLIQEVVYAVQIMGLNTFNLSDLSPDVLDLLLEEVRRHYDFKESCFEPELFFDSVKGCLAHRFHLADVPEPQPSKPAFSNSSTYLIVGGTQGFGLEFAKWLIIKHDVQHLILCSRSGHMVDSRAADFEQLCHAHNTNIVLEACDCSKKDEVNALIAKISSTMPPLKGIFLSQAVFEDQWATKQNWPSIKKVLSPKVYGSWFLHQATADIPLDHFMMFSSVTSVLGNPGQTAYGAANAFQDALAHYRSGQGLAGTSVNLSVLGNTGVMENNSALAMTLYRRGVITLPLKHVFTALDRVISNGVVQVTVAAINWDNHGMSVGSCPSQRQFLGEVIAHSRRNMGIARSKRPDVLELVAEGPVDQARVVLSKYIMTTVAQHLDTAVSDIDPNVCLEHLGFNSMLTVQLIQTIGDDLGTTFLSPQVLMESSCVDVVVNIGFTMCKRSLSVQDVQAAFANL